MIKVHDVDTTTAYKMEQTPRKKLVCITVRIHDSSVAGVTAVTKDLVAKGWDCMQRTDDFWLNGTSLDFEKEISITQKGKKR